MLNKAKANLLRILQEVYPSWIETSDPDYYFRADKIVNVRDYASKSQVQMVGRNFIIYADIKEQVVNYLKEFDIDGSMIVNLDI